MAKTITEKSGDIWLDRAAEAFDTSTSFVDANYRKQWDDDIRAFNSQHALGSKYHSDAYRYRSKTFRPKSRTLVRNNEAAAAAAFFSNEDNMAIEPENNADKDQRVSADVWQEVMNYRLKKTIPWFQVCIGGLQDASVTGVVCSKQYWNYQERTYDVYVPLIDPETGGPFINARTGKQETRTESRTETIADEPVIDLYPVENVRISPAAKWYDPIGTSPYIILMQPMYVGDVLERMDIDDPKTGQPKWHKADEQTIKNARQDEVDTTRAAREGNRQDSQDQQHSDELGEFDIVWVHENFMRIGGEDKVYFTLGTQHRLTDPKPLKECYHHNERPVTMGCVELETHKIMPAGSIEIGMPIQKECNEVANSRLDNLKLVLNKRYLVSRGKQVDIKSLVRNAAGSVTMVNDVNSDVREMEFNDVTQSSYLEQDRLNVDYDELLGLFSQGSVQTSNMGNTNGTLGGLQMIRGNSNIMTEFTLRLFAETWVEPTLRQVLKLEQAYETDTTLLTLCAERAKVVDRYGVDQITDEILNQELSLTVDVGGGATDPVARVERFLFALGKYAEIIQMLPPEMDRQVIAQEIFGRLGYKDIRRFYTDMEKSPQLQQAMQENEQLKQGLQQLQQVLLAEESKAKGRMEQEALKQASESRRAADKNDTDLLRELVKSENASTLEGMRAQANVLNSILSGMQKDNQIAQRPQTPQRPQLPQMPQQMVGR